MTASRYDNGPTDADPFNFIQRDLIIRSVVELRGADRTVHGDLLGVLDRAAVFDEVRDACRAEGVVADPGFDADIVRSAADHPPGVGLGHAPIRQLAATAACCAKEWATFNGRLMV